MEVDLKEVWEIYKKDLDSRDDEDYEINQTQMKKLFHARSFFVRYAVENGADYVFQTDSDGQTLPSEFEPFWIARSKYDITVGYRNKRRDGLMRVFVTKVLRLVVYLCFKVHVLDANTPYRLMSADTLKGNLEYIPDDFFLVNVALTAIYKKKRQKVHFIPISFRPRQGGKNSINLIKIIKVGVESIRSFIIISDKAGS